MKLEKSFIAFCMALAVLFIGCKNEDKKSETTEKKEAMINEDTVTYSLDTLDMVGYVAYDGSSDKKRPIVLVVHEWWGLNDYPKMRARQLAELGYLAFAIDVYGNGVTTSNPDTAGQLATPFYQDPQMTKARIDAAIARIKTHQMADTSKMAAIGYCFGGGVLLNTVRLGDELDGVVSFHGSLLGTPANKDLLHSKILVCHGAADNMVNSQVDQFKKQMDSIGADYQFISYPDALHAFTNPAATATGQKYNIPIAYNAAADSASWKDMQAFLTNLFK